MCDGGVPDTDPECPPPLLPPSPPLTEIGRFRFNRVRPPPRTLHRQEQRRTRGEGGGGAIRGDFYAHICIRFETLEERHAVGEWRVVSARMGEGHYTNVHVTTGLKS